MNRYFILKNEFMGCSQMRKMVKITKYGILFARVRLEEGYLQFLCVCDSSIAYCQKMASFLS